MALTLYSGTLSGAGTTTSLIFGAGSSGAHVEQAKSATFELNVTAAAAAAGDTLDVYVQCSSDGSNWDDFAHFAQVLGNGGAKVFYADWSRDVIGSSPHHAKADGSLAAGTVIQGPAGLQWRVKMVVAQASAAAFTLSVTAQINFRR